ncbi:MAG: DUF1848 domain-containing protein [Acetatifactor sp.]|nr:DUF1848 domain-containing protein [Acetatifactor sp.]
MILSVSRRTDIPNYYSEWFYNRIKDGYFYVRNPMNAHQISKIILSPEVVDCIVFWTKNPEPMLSRLDELDAYKYYFQFTLTGFGNDMERNVPHKKERMIPIFQKLANKIGRERVIWRYDPIIFTDRYTPEYHLRAFEQIAEELNGYTSKCVISFVDTYAKNKKNMNAMNFYSLPEKELGAFAAQIASTAGDNGIKVASCAEVMDLSACGIAHNCCIDRALVEQIIGYKIQADKDRNQRKECGCVESIETGTYNTCKNGCAYCYANYSHESVLQNSKLYDVNSPLLCGTIAEDDKITERAVKSLRESQLTLWDQ